MKKNEIEQILIDAEKNYTGNEDLAVAAHIYGDAVIRRSGFKVPHFADMQKIGGIKGLITRHKSKIAKAKAVANTKAEAAAKAVEAKAAKAVEDVKTKESK